MDSNGIDTIMAPLVTILSAGEMLAIRALVVQFGRLPDELVRHDGALHIRYMIMFWRITDGQPEVWSGIFPNEALHNGVVRIGVRIGVRP